MILASSSESNPLASLLILVVIVGIVVLVHRNKKQNAAKTMVARSAALDRARDLLASEGHAPSVIVACTTPVSCVNSKGTPYWFSEPRIVALTHKNLVEFDQAGNSRQTVHLSEVVSTRITRSAFDVTPAGGTKRSYRPYDADGQALLVQLEHGVRTATGR